MAIKHLQNLLGDKLHSIPLLVLYLTDGCNSRCVTCDIWRNPRRNMPVAQVDALLEAVETLGIRWLLLSGGEAMQHPEWHTIAARFKAAGVYVMLLTNGLLVSRQAAQVRECVDELIVSLDAATPQTYAAIRGVDRFTQVLDGIRAVRAEGGQVITRTTLQRANLHEFLPMLALGVAADVSRMSFLTVDVSSAEAFGARFTVDPSLVVLPPPQDNAPTLQQIDQFERDISTAERDYAALFAAGRIAESPAKLRRMAGYFRALVGQAPFEAPRCNAPHISTVIEVDGTVRPCYFLPAYGKLEGQTLLELLNSEAGLHLRRAYRHGERPECERCVCAVQGRACPCQAMKAFRGWRRREPVSTLPSLAAYAQWSADYPPVAHNPLMRAEQSAMWALMPHLAGRVVLDLAGGSGRYARLAHAAGAANVYVLDNSLPMLQIGQRCGVNAQFVEGDSAAIPLQAACVDVVICALALGHLPHIEPTFDEIRRILRTGGSLLISDFHPQLFAAGAQRTFTDAGGKLHAVEHYAHPTSHYLRCAAARDMHCTAQQAPHIAGIAQGRPLVAVYRFDCVR